MSLIVYHRALSVFGPRIGLTWCLAAGAVSGVAHAEPESPPGERPEQPAPKKPKPSGRTCTLLTREAPRGGRIELEVQHIGRTPLVLIAGQVSRLLLRKDNRVAAQIPRDSDGGPVTIKTEGEQVACGRLKIIGKD